ncbi:rod shape-determining protein MreD [Thermosyntropha lipolytica DSM 11003]|uniref:Rod shape-determining protein MreD n=1 Tax=Thermosyntropha lipolytica DSM 11003 TaxID=1123382 RepID=A0A1M5MMA7_9FIRM|nr:rod shape-determining protein MreD [Thermosyntropha lipolytica]SHG78520.1 rod shape-determining protein MreD [Thermosyntropha lipolytica DSM 11003]
MRYFVLTLLPIMALFLQSTFFSFYSINGVIPDLVLIFAVFFALFNGPVRGAFYGYLCGLLEDLFLGRLIGVNALAKALTAYIIGRLQGTVFKENLMVGVLGVFLATVVNSFLVLILNLAWLNGAFLSLNILKMVAWQIVYNIFLAIPVYIWYYKAVHFGVLKQGEERINEIIQIRKKT